MTTKRRARVPPSPPRDPPPSPPRPDWATPPNWPPGLPARMFWRQTMELRIGRVLEDDLRIPPWQRPVVWSPEAQCAFMQSVWTNAAFGSHVLLWQRKYDGPLYVVDGQQRLTSFGYQLTRGDGTINPCSAFLDLEEGRWYPERAPGRMTAVEAYAVRWADAPPFGRQLYLAGLAANRFDDAPMLATYIPPEVPKATVQAWFRSMTIQPAPLTPEEAARLIAAAEEDP